MVLDIVQLTEYRGHEVWSKVGLKGKKLKIWAQRASKLLLYTSYSEFVFAFCIVVEIDVGCLHRAARPQWKRSKTTMESAAATLTMRWKENWAKKMHFFQISTLKNILLGWKKPRSLVLECILIYKLGERISKLQNPFLADVILSC